VDPATTLTAVETRLTTEDFHVAFSITAAGAVQATLTGEVFAQGDLLRLRAVGRFADRDVDITLLGDGERLRGRDAGRDTIDLPQPPQLREAVVVGLVRMGVLHNVARLMNGRPPDHADGGVAEWVQMRDPVAEVVVEPTALSQEAEAGSPVSFALQVAGAPAGRATLWLDAAEGWPLERHQVVDFPGGQMQVREVYRRP
jgi:hypothetical protein